MKDLRERLIETSVRQSQDGYPISATLLGDAAKRIGALEAIVERVRAIVPFEVSQSGEFAVWSRDLEAALEDDAA